MFTTLLLTFAFTFNSWSCSVLRPCNNAFPLLLLSCVSCATIDWSLVRHTGHHVTWYETLFWLLCKHVCRCLISCVVFGTHHITAALCCVDTIEQRSLSLTEIKAQLSDSRVIHQWSRLPAFVPPGEVSFPDGLHEVSQDCERSLMDIFVKWSIFMQSSLMNISGAISSSVNSHAIHYLMRCLSTDMHD